MTFIILCTIAGALLISLALTGSVRERLPISAAMLYLALGVGLGPVGVGLIKLDLIAQAELLERLTEVAVIVSLFTAGLKLRTPVGHRLWWLPLRLATLSMALTVGAVAVVGSVGLGLSLGAAVLLGAILAPTDPVLASDVQVEHPQDRDTVRFGLTGEAGLNDGAAFPFVMLGLGLLGVHDLGVGGWRWLAIDVGWAVAGGLLIGATMGTLVGRLVLYLRRTHQEAVGLDDFLTLGLIALTYGVALLAVTYGFLAVFAAGLALRRVEQQRSGDEPPLPLDQPSVAIEERATDDATAHVYMAQAVLHFNEQLERIGEVAVVVLVGVMLFEQGVPRSVLWFAPLLFLVIRPLCVWVGTLGSGARPLQRSLIAWFGIRGIGSLYYLSYAVTRGVEQGVISTVGGLTLGVIALSIFVHGVSVTPLMIWYGRRRRRDEPLEAVTSP